MDKYTWGYYPSSSGGFWAYGIQTEHGTIVDPLEMFGTADEAKAMSDKANKGSRDGVK